MSSRMELSQPSTSKEPSKAINSLSFQHHWTILNFSHLLNDDSLSNVYSESFPPNCDKFQFSLRLTPKYIDNKSNCSFVSIFLYLKECEHEHLNVKYTITIENNKSRVQFKHSDEISNFQSEDCYGLVEFITKDDVQKLLNLSGDCLTIHCEIEIKNVILNSNVTLESNSTFIANIDFTKFSTQCTVDKFSLFYYQNCDQDQVFLKLEPFSPPNNEDKKFYIVLAMTKEENDEQNLKEKYPSQNYISIFLYFESDLVREMMVYYRVSILDWMGRPYLTGEGYGNMISKKDGKGSRNFIACNDLLDMRKGLLPDNKLSIYVHIEMFAKKTVDEEKQEEMSFVIKKFLNGKINLDYFIEYIERNCPKWFEIEGLCCLLRADVFRFVSDETRDELFKIFIRKENMWNSKVVDEFIQLINKLSFDIHFERSIEDWNAYKNMCHLVIMLLSHHDVQDNILHTLNVNQIINCLIFAMVFCKDEIAVQLTANALVPFPFVKFEYILLLHIEVLEDELIGEFSWSKHRNMCIMTWEMINFYNKHYVQCDDTANKYIWSATLNDRLLKYFTKLLQYCNRRKTILWAILAIEKLMFKKELSTIEKTKLRSVLKVYAKYFEINPFSLKCKFDSMQYQLGQCARWCLDNMLCENNKADDFDDLPHIKLSPDRLGARNDTDGFSPARSAFSVTSGIYFYEIILITSGQMQIGWTAQSATFTSEEGIGKDTNSVALDISRNCIWHGGEDHPIYKKDVNWRAGSVVGCLLDMKNHVFVFYLNGEKIECQRPIEYKLVAQAYSAAVSLDTHQQCRFNFGQTSFRHPPKTYKTFKHFHKSTRGVAARYRLMDIGTIEISSYKHYWFKHEVLNNQVKLVFADQKQTEVDALVKQLEHNIKNKQPTVLNLNQIGCLRFVQSVIEVLQIWLKDEKYIFGHLIHILKKKHESSTKNILIQLCELIYPYTILEINSQNLTQCLNVCIIMMEIFKIYPDLPNEFPKKLNNILLINNFINIKTFITDPMKMLNALISFEKVSQSDDKRWLIDNQEFISTLFWCADLFGQVNYGDSLYDLLRKTDCDLLRLQVGFCARWFLNNMIKGEKKNFSLISYSHLNPAYASPYLKLSSDFLSARSDWHWQSMLSNFSANKNVSYYEVIILTSGEMKIGWATEQTNLNNCDIGDDNYSIGVDGHSGRIYHQLKYAKCNVKSRWRAGDVVGCLIDFNKKNFEFYLNGKQLQYQMNIYFSTQPYHVAVSLSTHQQCYFNMGQTLFKYSPVYNGVRYEDSCSVSKKNFRILNQFKPNLSKKCYEYKSVLVNEQVELFFDDLEQTEKDFIKQFEQIILDSNVATTFLDCHDEQSSLKRIQAFIEMAGKSSIEKIDIIANWIAHFIRISAAKSNFFPDLICKMLYNYFVLKLTKHTVSIHRNVCIVLACLLTVMTNFEIRTNLYNQVLTYLTEIAINCVQIDDEWLFIFSFISLEHMNLNKNDIQNLKSNAAFYRFVETKNNQNLNEHNSTSTKSLRNQSIFATQWFIRSIFELTDSIKSDFEEFSYLMPKTTKIKLFRDMRTRSDWNWQSIHFMTPRIVPSFYYEVTIETNGPMRFGWASQYSTFIDNNQLLGDDNLSIGFDGYERRIWHCGKSREVSNISQWSAGDVIGCLINETSDTFKFYLNGKAVQHGLYLKFEVVQTYYAAASLSMFQQCRFKKHFVKEKEISSDADYSRKYSFSRPRALSDRDKPKINSSVKPIFRLRTFSK